MAVTSVLTSGQWGYPIQGLGSYAEEEKSSFMLFTSEHLKQNLYCHVPYTVNN